MTTEAATPTDRALLDRFCADRDEAAFRQLVARHEGMVRAIARRVLGDPAAADDVLQATLFVLATRADQLRRQTRSLATLGPWLNRVATNAALQVRRSNQARTRREQVIARHRPTRALPPESDTAEALPVLDEELLRLPERLRAPLVLCCLEGTPMPEAAAALGVSFATVRRRLDEARERLRSRLMRRGVALSAAALTQILDDSGARAATTEPPGFHVAEPLRLQASALGQSVLDRMDGLAWRRRIATGAAWASVLLLGLGLAAAGPRLRVPGPVAPEPTPVRSQPPRGVHPADPVDPVVAPAEPGALADPGDPAEPDAGEGFFVAEMQVNGVMTRFDDRAAFDRALRAQGLATRPPTRSNAPGEPLDSRSSSPSTATVLPSGVRVQGGAMAGGSASVSVTAGARCCCERFKGRSSSRTPAARPRSCDCRPCPSFPEPADTSKRSR